MKAATPTDDQIREYNRHGVKKRLLDMQELQYVLNVGRSTAFDLVMSGDIDSIKIRNRRLVPIEAVDKYLAANAND